MILFLRSNSGGVAIINVLLSNGADIALRDNVGETAAHKAGKSCNYQAMKVGLKAEESSQRFTPL